MQVFERQFSDNLLEKVEHAKQKVREKYGLNPGNNINLICEKLVELKSNSHQMYIECGVFQGTTLFTVATFAQQESIDFSVLGFDSFEGFPSGIVDEKDRPQFFAELLKKNMITKKHYEKAAKRTNGFTNEDHLTKKYFLDIKKVFDIAKDFDNVHLIKGPFNDTLKTIDQPISVLFLDCDLYQSYLDCLNVLYPSVVSGGAIIFDEYYSLKYPGPRLAVNEFFKIESGYFQKYLTDDDFERWCFVKD